LRPPAILGSVVGARARWILLPVVAILVAATCVRLGFWQLDRLAGRRAFNAGVEAGLAAPVAPVDALVDAEGADEAAYRRASATGTWDPAHEVILYGRPLDGRPGDHVLTPLLLAMLCASCERSPCRFIVQFEWTGPLTWVDSSSTHRRRSLTAEETGLVTQTAGTTLAAAFAEFPRVCIGARGKPTDVLHVLYPDSAASPADEMRVGGRMFFGQSWICSYWFCPPTQINYDLHLTSAQIFAERLQITSRDDILRAVGRGIGNTAAHEFGHRRNFIGMDRDGDQWFTDGGDAEAMFYGPPLSWPPETLADMRRKLR